MGLVYCLIAGQKHQVRIRFARFADLEAVVKICRWLQAKSL